jgi:hypothetical protein
MKRLIFPALLLSTSLAACGDEPDAKLTTATDAQISRAFLDTSGAVMDGFITSMRDAAGKNDGNDCPKIATDHNTTTVSGHCVEDGRTSDTDITLVNFPWKDGVNPDYDPKKPSTATVAIDVTGENPGKIDATVDLTWNGDKVATFDTDWNMTYQGIESTSELHGTISGDTITIEDSREDIVGVGNATVEGAFSLDNPRSGKITLHGADGDLVLDVSSFDNDTGCVAYAIGDKRGQACLLND